MNFDLVAREISSVIQEPLYLNEPLNKYTTWRIGGPADLMIFPTSIDTVKDIATYAKGKGFLLTVIGNGSNLLIRDKGIRGIVLKLNKLNNILIEGNIVRAQSGALLPTVTKKALETGLTGLEFGAGIPASVGGATIMNAGTYQGQMADYVREVKVVHKDGSIVALDQRDLGYTYRYSNLKGKDSIVVETTFECQQGSVEEARKMIKAALEKRKASQPLNFPSAGSVFKNPSGDSAGRLIEAAGLKGTKCGGAQISEKHGNFIVNLGGATAFDVTYLMEKVQNVVAEKFGINLEPEVLTLGE